MIAFFLALILALAIAALKFRKHLHGVIALAGVSLLLAAVLYLLHAPDVAITEAAMGAGISTIVFLWVIKHTRAEKS